MNFFKIAKNISPIIAMLVILYFAIVGLLIADKTQDLKLLYFAEILVTIIIFVIAGTAISLINLVQLLSSRNQLILNHLPAVYAIYDLKDKAFIPSEQLSSILGVENKKLIFDHFLSHFTTEDQSEIAVIMKSAAYSSEYIKTGIIKIAGSENKKEKFYRYVVKLVSGKVLCFWLIDYTDVILDEIELVELVKKYRVASFELGQIIDILPLPIWRQDLDGEIIFHNAKFGEFKKKYNLDLKFAERTSKQLQFTKRMVTKDKVSTFSFSKLALADHSGLVGLCIDRTEVEEINRSIKTLENILEKLIENISVGFLVLDQELKVVNFNLAFINIFSFDSSILAKKPTYRYVLDALKDNNLFPELKGFKDKHLQDIREVKDCSTDLFHILNGITIKVTIIPSKDGNTILTYENITPNLEVERELTKTKLMFNSIVNMIEFPMIVISQNGQINFINNLFIQSFFKLSMESDVPSNLNELINANFLVIKDKDVNMLRGLLIDCLESKNCKTHSFKIGRISYTAQTMGLDDLSVILIIKKL